MKVTKKDFKNKPEKNRECSNQEKDINREYGRNRYRNMPKEAKKNWENIKEIVVK